MAKIHIIYKFQDGPWGGGNQFLKGLREYMRKQNIYSETLEKADIVLVNSHHLGSIDECKYFLDFLSAHPAVKVIHRIDGPVTLIRNKNEGTDNIIFQFNRSFADATIFQSLWSLSKCKELGWEDTNPSTVILNAPDPTIFHSAQKGIAEGKTKIVATSWAANFGKGFDVYQWMDQHLDWNKYSMTFVGNSPVSFKNIIHLEPQPSDRLSETLRSYDIYITASRNDPCSNSLIEALHCGLPALVYNDGGHPEIVGNGGLVFSRAEEIPVMLESLSDNLDHYRENISLPDIEAVAESYFNFSMQISAIQPSRRHEHVSSFLESYKNYCMSIRPSLLQRILSKSKSLLRRIIK
jgi:hypothetical protein